jgi:hypothetical protein
MKQVFITRRDARTNVGVRVRADVLSESADKQTLRLRVHGEPGIREVSASDVSAAKKGILTRNGLPTVVSQPAMHSMAARY